MKNDYYVVMRLCRFDTHIEVEPASIGIVRLDWPTGADNPEWFMPVFERYEDAVEWADDGKYDIGVLRNKA